MTVRLPFAEEADDTDAEVRTYTPEQYVKDGKPWVFGHTNPWLEVDGIPVDWMEAPPLPERQGIYGLCECIGPLPGVLVGADEPAGIQRHDWCAFTRDDLGRDDFDDLDAAWTLARLIPGAVVRYWSTPRY